MIVFVGFGTESVYAAGVVETFILIGSGLFALYCYYQKEEFKSSLRKQAKSYCETHTLYFQLP